MLQLLPYVRFIIGQVVETVVESIGVLVVVGEVLVVVVNDVICVCVCVLHQLVNCEVKRGQVIVAIVDIVVEIGLHEIVVEVVVVV